MADIVSRQKRSKMMAGIRGQNTRPEIAIRKELHKRGYRYSLHRRDLPGKPDLVMPKYNVVIFVHGCFWHRHTCHLFKWPSSRVDFWRDKINGNIERDSKQLNEIRSLGWRVLIVWECAIKGKKKRGIENIADEVESFLNGNETFTEITGSID